jgi:hypothetical protein
MSSSGQAALVAKTKFGIKPILPYLIDPIRGPAVIARFWSNVARAGQDECWDWTACRGGKGLYGQTTVGGGRIRRANRVAWTIANNEDPGDPVCSNPAHLVAGSHEDNMTDMVVRGRSAGRPATRASMTNASLCARNEQLLSALNQIADADPKVGQRALQAIAAQALRIHGSAV